MKRLGYTHSIVEIWDKKKQTVRREIYNSEGKLVQSIPPRKFKFPYVIFKQI